MLTSQTRQPAQATGFTLIELLVVIGIIIVLAGIGLTVGRSVIAGGQKSATADTIRLLENAAYDYAEETGANPSAVVDVVSVVRDPSETTTSVPEVFWPVADAAFLSGSLNAQPDDILPSTALFLLDMRLNSPGSYDLISGIDPELSGSSAIDFNGDGSIDREDITLPTILDAFGNPIRFVHPAYDGGYGEYWDGEDETSQMRVGRDPFAISNVGTGAQTVQLRRSFRPENDLVKKGDADEGICRNDRPYFYSAGVDADPGTLIDNVYSDDNRPTFPFETFGDEVERKASGRVLSGAS